MKTVVGGSSPFDMAALPSSSQVNMSATSTAAVSNGSSMNDLATKNDCESGSKMKDLSDESIKARIEQISRERPRDFTGPLGETTFVFSIAMSQFMTEYLVSGFPVVLPTIIKELNIPESSSVWPATAFSLVVASTLLVFGRLGDMRGSYPVFVAGLSWLLIWNVVAGFSVNPIMLDVCRALQGLGSAAILPTGVGMMGSLYRPGRRKNMVFAIYGTMGILGFFGGIFFAGIIGQFLSWGWYFWIAAILTAITLGTTIWAKPCCRSQMSGDKSVKMDYPGAVTIISGLVLLVFALTESAHAQLGWKTPYIPALFSLGVVLLLVAMYLQLHVSKDPLLPFSLFKAPALSPLLIALLLLYGGWGIFSVYGTMYFQNIMSASPLQVVAWYVPLGVVGFATSILEGFILHAVPGKILLIISGLGALGSQLLLALMPLHGAYYWAWIFPATILATLGIDLSVVLATVFVTTSFPIAQQGLAGGVINSVLQLGVALVVGLTDIVQSGTVADVGLAKSYKNTFWFGVAAGTVSLVVLAVWGKVPKATSSMTSEEIEELKREAYAEV